ncbi:MAG: ABC transporter permease subunit [Acidobacteriota bacterium]
MRVFTTLLAKTLREQAGALAFSLLLLSVLFALGGYLFKTFGDMSSQMMSRVSPEILAGLFGGALGGLSPLETWLVTLFVHPVMLVVLASIVIASSSRAMAAEIDDGTVDLLLSYPVPRWIVVAVSFAAIQLQLIVLCIAVLVSLRGGLIYGEIGLPERWSGFLWVTFNLWALYFSASGVALWISAASSERGAAIARSLGFLVVSFFANLLGSLWPKVEALRIVSIFNYHQPQPTLEAGGPLWGHLAVLLLVGAVGTGAAFWRFVSRDIHVA